MEEYLKSTYFLDYNVPIIQEYLSKKFSKKKNLTASQIVKELFFFVRDEIEYRIQLTEARRFSLKAYRKKYLKASRTLKKGYGFCVPKAILLTTLIRGMEIPAKMHFAHIKNHKLNETSTKLFGTNHFYWHGYTEAFIDGKWVKMSPTFDSQTSIKNGFPIVEFDGSNDAIFPQTDNNGELFIQYLEDLGCYKRIPYYKMICTWKSKYAKPFIKSLLRNNGNDVQKGKKGNNELKAQIQE